VVQLGLDQEETGPGVVVARDHAAGRVDPGGDAEVDRAHQGAAQLDGAQHRQPQVQLGLLGADEPGVVGHVHQEVGPELVGDAPPQPRQGVLVAVEHPQGQLALAGSPELQGAQLLARDEAAAPLEQAPEPGQVLAQGTVSPNQSSSILS